MIRPEKVKVKTEQNPSLSSDAAKDNKRPVSDRTESEIPEYQESGQDSFFDDSWTNSGNTDFSDTELHPDPNPFINDEYNTRASSETEGSNADAAMQGEAEIKREGTHQRNPKEPTIEIPFDEQMSYFFMFGVKGSGKSSILSSLIYYLRVLRIGDSLDKLSKTHLDFDRRGEELMDEFYKQVGRGLFPGSTSTLSSEGQKIPRQMPLSFKPADIDKSEFRLCLMDMSGEDLMKVRPDKNKGTDRLPEGIEVFLDISQSNLCFILVYSVYEALSHSDQELYFDRFFDILTRKGLKEVPILLLMSKWDLVHDQFESVEDFLKKEAPLIWHHVNNPDRIVTIMPFSIGHVDTNSNTYVYDHRDTEKLFAWMYHTQLGKDLNQQVDQSLFKRFWDGLNPFKKSKS
jgi:hypothetical protein